MEELVITLEEALVVQEEIGFPCEVKSSFKLDGSYSKIAYNEEEFVDICKKALKMSPISEIAILSY